jgi:predicted metal-dependent hydrolase
VSLQVLPSGEVVVRAPLRTSRAEIDAFVHARGAWLAGALARTQSRPAPRPLSDGDVFPLWGEPHRLVMLVGTPPSVVCSAGEARVTVPGGAEAARALLAGWLAEQVRVALPPVVAAFEATLDVRASGIVVANQRRRWASCSSGGTLRFNWRLALLPPQLFRSVVAHEVAHLVELNHSPRFWETVARIAPAWREERVALRTWERTVGAQVAL